MWSMRVEEVAVDLVGDIRSSLLTMALSMGWEVLSRSMLKSPRRRRDLQSDGGSSSSVASRLVISDGSLDGGL